MLLLSVHAASEIDNDSVAEIDNGSPAILLSKVFDVSKSTFPISLDKRQTSPNFNQVRSSTLLDENGQRRWCCGSSVDKKSC